MEPGAFVPAEVRGLVVLGEGVEGKAPRAVLELDGAPQAVSTIASTSTTNGTEILSNRKRSFQAPKRRPGLRCAVSLPWPRGRGRGSPAARKPGGDVSFLMATDSNLKCPKYGHDFKLSYSQFDSFSDPSVPGLIWREGAHRFAVKCPSCRKRSHYHMTDDGRQLTTW